MTTSDLFAPSAIVPVKRKKSAMVEMVNVPNDNAYEALNKSLMSMDGQEDKPVKRLAFEVDPTTGVSIYASLYRPKQKGLSDIMLKRLSVQASIVASIVGARGNQVSAFGRPQPDRFSTGYKIKARPDVLEGLGQDDKEALQKRIAKAEQLFLTCGKTSGTEDTKELSFSQFLFMTTRNALVFGRVAVEAIPNAEGEFHSFRPIDAGTIYFATAQKDAADNVRRQAQNLLARLKNEKPEVYIDSRGRNVDELFGNDEYAWVQVIDDKPRQFFTAKECLVHNFYPVTDIESEGYPLTPLDTVVSDVTTFINITTHNRLFFQSGRAARGAIVCQSDDIDDIDLQQMRQQFQANINGVGNSWRTPLFKVGKDDKVDWFSIDSNARDQEYQYLSDSNARTILSGFQMSPEELSGYAHLSRGTNSQALCLHPDTQIWTQVGATTIGDLLGTEREVCGFNVWTGTGWSPARAFVTGSRRICKTTTSNGITITSSPEHRFRVVESDGSLGWREQRDLVVGDVVLVNRQPVPGDESNIPSYRGRKLTKDMMEVLGWLTGDGTLTVRKAGKVHHSKQLEFYYHHIKEVEIRERHFQILKSFGLNPRIVDRQVSRIAVERQKRVCGFQSVADVRRNITLSDTVFVEWLLSLGFVPSSQHKAIPAFIHGLPVELRGAFLKGFFSADGSCDTLNTPSITIASLDTREATKKLLLNMGIRTRYCEGTTRTSFVKVDGQESYKKEYIKAPSKLIIKDKLEFYERIGFLQPHKQPDLDALKKSDCRWIKTAASVALNLCDKILSRPGMGHEERDVVRHALADNKSPFRTLSNVQRIAEKYREVLPKWTSDFYQESVVQLETSNDSVEMVDVEVFDQTHAFVANGLIVHNSESNVEYQLEAHRDTGIRPLLWQMQNFINHRIFPLIDAELAKICTFAFVGLDAETAEKETTRLQSDATVHMTYDQILQKVEKKPLGAKWGGSFPLNPGFQQILDRYMTVGQILEGFFGVANASKDPRLDYRRDEYWFRQVDVLNQKQQLEQQAQAQQQQAMQGAQQPGQGDPSAQQGAQQPQDAQQAAPQQGTDQQAASQPQQDPNQPDLSTGIDQLAGLLNKSESQLPMSKRHLLAQQRMFISRAMSTLEEESKIAIKEIAGIAKKHIAPK